MKYVAVFLAFLPFLFALAVVVWALLESRKIKRLRQRRYTELGRAFEPKEGR